MNKSKEDSRYMKHAVRLAKRAFGMTSPNPLVGAVIVKNGRIIGGGWHKRCRESAAGGLKYFLCRRSLPMKKITFILLLILLSTAVWGRRNPFPDKID